MPPYKPHTKILRWWDGHVLWEGDGTLPEVLAAAVEAGADLSGASLDGARLDGARLDGARLVRASLVRASLVRASLDGASLDGARLDGASLDGARLDGASLDGASLDGASLDGASLVRASLDGASLVRASLEPIREDLYKVLADAPAEVPGLLAALQEGRVDGSTYTGTCACLVGTLRNVARECARPLPPLVEASYRPAEVWFLAIRPGDVPAHSPVAAITTKWVEEWLAARPQPPLTAGA